MSDTIDDIVKDGYTLLYTAVEDKMAIYKKGQVRAMVGLEKKKVVTLYPATYKNEKEELKAYEKMYGGGKDE